MGTGGSFGDSSLRQEIGLGQAVKIEFIEVVWPKPGTPKSVFTDVPMDGCIKLVEGAGAVETVRSGKMKLKN